MLPSFGDKNVFAGDCILSEYFPSSLLHVRFSFRFLFVFCVSLGYFVLVLLAFVVLGLVSSVLSQEIG